MSDTWWLIVSESTARLISRVLITKMQIIFMQHRNSISYKYKYFQQISIKNKFLP
jgi:hypothetical protein